MPPTRQQLGDIIRQARTARGLTGRAVAQKLDIDAGYYSGMESGRRAIGKYARPLAKLLGMDPDELEALEAAKLPNYRPYLRAKYELPDEAITELEAHFESVRKQYSGRKRAAR